MDASSADMSSQNRVRGFTLGWVLTTLQGARICRFLITVRNVFWVNLNVFWFLTDVPVAQSSRLLVFRL